MLTNVTNGTNITSQSLQTIGPLITDDTYRVIELVEKTTFNTAVSLFGIVTNIINIVVFISQRFSDAVNISLFGLAVSDLGGLTCLLWMSIGAHPWLIQFVNVPYEPDEFIFVTAGLLRVCFARASGYITIFITIQRCVCVSKPLKMSTVLRPRQTIFIVVFIFVTVIISLLSAIYFTGAVKISTQFYPYKNRTLLGVIWSRHFRGHFIVSSGFVSFIQISSFFTIIASTGILVINLNRKTKWRNEVANSLNKQLFAKRDRILVKLVISLSTILIICCSPGIVALIISYIVPSFSTFGEEENLFKLIWMGSSFLEATNCSISIFVYYKMSSKYRQTFDEIFCRVKRTVETTINVV